MAVGSIRVLEQISARPLPCGVQATLASLRMGLESAELESTRARGARALARAEWSGARAEFESILAARADDACALDGLGEALWWLGEWSPARELRERAFLRHKDEGRAVDAARIAIWLANEYMLAFANRAAWNGWLSRAQELLDAVPPSVQRGWLVLTRGRRAERPEDVASACEQALAIAREFGDADLEAFASSQLGRAWVALGRLEEGFARLDAAMAAVTAGEIKNPVAISETCCNMLTTCEGAADMDRLVAWTRVTDEISQHLKGKTIYAFCRFQYSSVLIARGRWAEAEAQLEEARSSMQQSHPAYTPHVLAKLAELRVAQGRLPEAEALLSGLEESASAARAVARLRLAAGDPLAALRLLTRRLSQTESDRVQAAPLRALVVEAQLALGDVAAARAAALALRQDAELTGRAACLATAELMLGLTALAAGDAAAWGHLDLARERFSALDLPLEVARTRLALARAVAAEDPSAARDLARAAHADFERLGAARDVDRAAAVLRELGVPLGPGKRSSDGLLSAREQEVLALLGTGLSNAAIGQRLFISPKTVEHHVGKILGKLGLKNRGAAVAYLLERR